jgi:hypothetical protein
MDENLSRIKFLTSARILVEEATIAPSLIVGKKTENKN